MKKTTRYILILLILLIGLGGGAAALYFTQPQEEESPEDSAVSTTVTKLFERDAAELSTVSLENAEGSYTMTAHEQPGDSSETAEIAFSIDGAETYDIKEAEVTSFAKSLGSLYTSKDIGEQEDLAQYGLNGTGLATIRYRYQDGSEDQIVVGNEAGASSGRYVLKDGKIYIVTGFQNEVFGSLNLFINTQILEIESIMITDDDGNVTGEENRMEKLTLSGTAFADPIEIEAGGTGLTLNILTAPVAANANSTKLDEITLALKDINATAVIVPEYTEEDLAAYGLDNPAATADYRINGQSNSVSVSEKTAEGTRYLISENKASIYEIGNDAVSAWAETKLMDIRSAYIILPNIMEVDRLSVGVNGAETLFEISRAVNEEKTTETNVQYDLTIKSNGREIDYSEAYQPFYKLLISLSVLSSDPAEYDAESTPIFSVEYRYFEGGSESLAVYAIEGQDRCAVELNGAYTGVAKQTSIDSLIQELAKITEG